MLVSGNDASAASKKVVRGDASTGSQRAIVKTSSVKVVALSRRTTRVRLFATFRTYAKRAPEQVITRIVEVNVQKNKRRRVTLRLNRIGRGIARSCAGGRIVVSATRIESKAGPPIGKSVRTFKKLRRDAAGCRAGGGSAGGGSGGGSGGGGSGGGGSGGGGSGGGSGGGGSGGGGTGGGTNTNREPVDYEPANPDRCDWLDEADCMFPFPNDHFTVADSSTDTKRRINFNLLSMPRNRAGKPVDPLPYNRNDGYSPGQEIVTKVPGLDTPAAFAKTASVPVDDMAQSFNAKQPVVVIDTVTRARHLIWTEIDSNPPTPEDVTFIIRPGVNFKEGRRYVVAMRNLKGADGKTLGANEAFRIYRDGIPTNSDAVEGRRPSFEGMFKTLAEAGIERDDLYRAWDFTVASERNLSERMLKIRDDAFAKLGDTNLADMKIAGDSPTFKVEKIENYLPTQNANLLRRVHGTVTVPCYLNAPGCPSGSRFAFNPAQAHGPPETGGAAANRMEARFSCIVPRKAATAPARVSMYGHGLLGSRSEVGQGQLQNFAQEHNVIFCATEWIGMACADLPDPPDFDQEGFQNFVNRYFTEVAAGRVPAPPDCDYGSVLTILEDMGNFPQLADRVQQGILNFLYIGRALIHPEGFAGNDAFKATPGGASMIDTGHERLYYDGNSQGGIIGGALMAFYVDGDRGVLGVPGMNYSTLLQRSKDWGTGKPPEPEADLPEYSWFMYTAYPDQLQRQLLLSMIQMQWDRAEANGYAHHMTKDPFANTPPHEVMLHVGLGDHQVAQLAAEVEARTIGAATHDPYADPGRDLDRGDPAYGIPRITTYPFQGSALILWDIGPPRPRDATRYYGTLPPPNENVPPPKTDSKGIEYQDPHEYPRRQPSARQQKSAFFAPGGPVIDVCPTGPCLADPKL
jgi:hypothetical protein